MNRVNRVSRTEYDRLKDVLLYDKINAPARLNDVVKSDVLEVLENYMELVPGSFRLELEVTNTGYEISITGKGTRLKGMGGM